MAKRVVAEDGKPSEELQQLVAEADTGGRAAGGFAGKLIFAVAVAWSLFQLWYASPLPFTFGCGDPERHRGALAAPRLRAVPRVPLLSAVQAPAQQRSLRTTGCSRIAGAFAGAYFLLFYAELATRPGQPTLQDIVVATVGHRAAARGDAARGRLADDGPRDALPRLHHARALPARRARAQGRVARAHAVAPVAHHRGRVRRRARRVGRLHLRLRAVRLAARPRRRRQLHDAGVVRAARPPARRAGEGRGGVLGAERPDLGLVGVERGLGRHLHHPADEEGRLRRRQGRRDRDRLVGERPDHAAGDGRGRVPDGRVRRHPVHRDRQARVPAGDALVHRALLHRAPRGAEARHAADGAGAQAHAAAEAARLGPRHLGHHRRSAPDLLRRRGREERRSAPPRPGSSASCSPRSTSTRVYVAAKAPTCRTTSTSTTRCCPRPGRR